MRLISLKISNFKGIREFSLPADGQDITVAGDNGTGKTTLADAFSWLLFGKDSLGRSDFEIGPLDADGRVIDNVASTVDATLRLADGSERTLTRTYAQKWAKKRGAAQAELTGYTTDYRVDGVPAKKSEFTAAVAALADESVFPQLTDPRLFCGATHWQDRRRLLLEICGDVADADIIGTVPALAGLPAILGSRSVDDHRKVVAGRRTELNREIDRIPVRIDEARRSMPEAPAGNPLADIEALRAQRSAAADELAQLKSGGRAAELRKQLAEANANASGWRQRAADAYATRVRKCREQRADVEARIAASTRDLSDMDRRVGALAQEIIRIDEQMADKRAEWHAVRQLPPPTCDVADACPACRQPLPADRVAAALAEATAQANDERAQLLAEIIEAGNRLKTERAEIARRLDAMEADRNPLRTALYEDEEALRDLPDDIPVPGPSPELVDLEKQIAALEASIADAEAGGDETMVVANATIATIDSLIAAAETAMANVRAREQAEQRIAALTAEQKTMVGELERIERELYLCEQFVRAKVSALTDRINSRFALVRWNLFDELINGGVQEICEATVGGVPWGSLNNASRINAGLEIIDVLGEHYGAHPPIFIDNAESVVRIRRTEAQQIRLVVSPGIKKLTVETE